MNEPLLYEDSLKHYNDLKNSLDTAQQEGYQQAWAEYAAKLEEEQKRTEQEKQKAEQEKQRAEQEKQRAEQERILKEEALATLENERKTFVQSVQNMHNMGLDKAQIAQITNRSIAEIEALLEKK